MQQNGYGFWRQWTLHPTDDQIVIIQDKEDLEYMNRKLMKEYRKWGLEMNINKTQYLHW